MNRRGFFAKALAGVAAAVGLRKADGLVASTDPTDTLIDVRSACVVGRNVIMWDEQNTYESPLTPEWVEWFKRNGSWNG